MTLNLLIDNGHGRETPGKRSPDGLLREWEWTRRCAREVCARLNALGRVNAALVTPEEHDVSLAERVRRVNDICKRHGARNCLLLSIHNNAAGGGAQWLAARGFSPWVYTKAGEQARRMALILQTLAETRGLKGNRAVPPRKYWEANFYILKHTACAAVLTECLFQDNREDVDYLLSDEGFNTLVKLHVDAVIKFA